MLTCRKCARNFERDPQNTYQVWCQTCIDQAKCQHCDSTEEVTVEFPHGTPWVECKACQEKAQREIWVDRDKYFRLAESFKKQLESLQQNVPGVDVGQLITLTEQIHEKEAQISRLQEDLAVSERQTFAEWSGKYHPFISKWKTTIQQEITLLRQVLNSHDQ